MEGLGVYQHELGRQGSRYRLQTPALLLDLDALEHNADQMNRFLGGTDCTLRPHAKAHKSGSIARLQMEWGATGISCATLAEAEAMARAGVQNILVTSPIATPASIERLLALSTRIEELLVVADNEIGIARLGAAASERNSELGVLIEYDVGQNRTGAIDEQSAIKCAQLASDHPHLDYRGIQAYYGHLQHITSYSDREAQVNAQLDRIRSLVDALTQAGLPPREVSGGGTGTFHIDLAGNIFTELQVGSYLLMDVQYSRVELTPEDPTPFRNALFVQSSVTSVNQLDSVIVNAGWKAFSTEAEPPTPYSGIEPGSAYSWMGDEHGGVQVSPSHPRPEIGTPIEFIPYHCDPTVNLYRVYHCVRQDVLTDLWPIDANGYGLP